MGSETAAADACPETLSVPTRLSGPAVVVAVAAGVGCVLFGGLLAVVVAGNMGLVPAAGAGLYLAFMLAGLAAGVRDWLASRDGVLTLSPETIAFRCRLYDAAVPTGRLLVHQRRTRRSRRPGVTPTQA